MMGGIHTSMQIDGHRYNWCNCNTLYKTLMQEQELIIQLTIYIDCNMKMDITLFITFVVHREGW